MEGSALKEIIQPAEQSTRDLHTGVSQKLTEAGHPATPQSIDPQDQSPLEEIKEALGDTAHVVGSSFEEFVGGTSPDTHDRTIRGHNVVFLIKERAGRLFRRRKAA